MERFGNLSDSSHERCLQIGRQKLGGLLDKLSAFHSLGRPRRFLQMIKKELCLPEISLRCMSMVIIVIQFCISAGY